MIKLPAMFSDGMVIEKKAKIWGTSDVNEHINIMFLDKSYEIVADQNGHWEVFVESTEFGGPHEMKIGDILIKDIMIGYVWLCSGQSNMEIPINRVRTMFEDELSDVNYPSIRAFLVNKKYKFNEELQLYKGDWTPATNEYIDSFFATSYFFAQKLWKKYNIPIGLINTAAGGSRAEAWMSSETLEQFPEIWSILEECKNTDYVKQTEKNDLKNMNEWFANLDDIDEGKKGNWESREFDDTSWRERELTADWSKDLNINGSVWFRKTINVPETMIGKEATLFLGRVTDSNYVYVNGKFVGRIEYKYPPSIFKLPAGTLQEGENLISVRVISSNGLGEFETEKPYKIVCNGHEVSLLGKWKYKISAVTPPMPESTFFFTRPAGLYNAMLSPVIGYSITGAIWYQGESNTHQPEGYKELMEALVNEWRTKWQKDFPFIYTQLTNFEANSARYPHSKWAELREQQLLCLSIPNTAMAVTIDCGESNDLHPQDKKTIGERLADAALKTVYGEDIVYSGPIAREARLDNGKIAISFDHIGSGLTSVGDDLECFEIETNYGSCYKCDAKISGERVIVEYVGDIANVKFVRYAWADNPLGANLYNKEHFPASPFRLKI